LIDSFYCSQPATFISATLLVTATMLRLELPHVNVLSKVRTAAPPPATACGGSVVQQSPDLLLCLSIQIDLLKQYGDLPFELNFFTDMLNLSPLLRYLDGRIAPTEELEQRERRRYESAGESKRSAVDDNDHDGGDDDDEDDGEGGAGAAGTTTRT
jgi:hypothetical protein